MASRMTIAADARGVFPIAPTPFLEDGAVDFESIDRLTDFYLACGATGVTVLGQLGEAPKLAHAEGVALAARILLPIPPTTDLGSETDVDAAVSKLPHDPAYNLK